MSTCKIINDKYVSDITSKIKEEIKENGLTEIGISDSVGNYDFAIQQIDEADVRDAILKIKEGEEESLMTIMSNLFNNSKYHLYKVNNSNRALDTFSQKILEQKLSDSKVKITFDNNAQTFEIYQGEDYKEIRVNPHLDKENFFNTYRKNKDIYFKFIKGKGSKSIIASDNFKDNFEFLHFILSIAKDIAIKGLPNAFTPVINPYYNEAVKGITLLPSSSFYGDIDFFQKLEQTREVIPTLRTEAISQQRDSNFVLKENKRLDNILNRIRRSFNINLNNDNIDSAIFAHYLLGFTDRVSTTDDNSNIYSLRVKMTSEEWSELNLEGNSLQGLLYISQGMLNKHLSNAEREEIKTFDNDYSQLIYNMAMFFNKKGISFSPAYLEGRLSLNTDLENLNTNRTKNEVELSFLEDINNYLFLTYSDLIPSSRSFFEELNETINSSISANSSISLNNILMSYVSEARKFNETMIVKDDTSGSLNYDTNASDTTLDLELIETVITDANLPTLETNDTFIKFNSGDYVDLQSTYYNSVKNKVSDKRINTLYNLLGLFKKSSQQKKINGGYVTVSNIIDNLINYYTDRFTDDYTYTNYFKAELLNSLKHLDREVLSIKIYVNDLNEDLRKKYNEDNNIPINAKDIKLYENDRSKNSIILNYIIPDVYNYNETGERVRLNTQEVLFQSILGQVLVNNKNENGPTHKQAKAFLEKIKESIGTLLINNFKSQGASNEEAKNLAVEEAFQIENSLKYKGLDNTDEFFKELLVNESLQKLLMKIDATGIVKVDKTEGKKPNIFSRIYKGMKDALSEAVELLHRALFGKKDKYNSEQVTSFDEALQLLSDTISLNNRNVTSLSAKRLSRIKWLNKIAQIEPVNRANNALLQSENLTFIENFLNISLEYVNNTNDKDLKRLFDEVIKDAITSNETFSYIENFFALIASNNLNEYGLEFNENPFVERDGSYSTDFKSNFISIFYKEDNQGENYFKKFLEDLRSFSEDKGNKRYSYISQKKYVFKEEKSKDKKGRINTVIRTYPTINIKKKLKNNSYDKGYLVYKGLENGYPIYQIKFFDNSSPKYVAKDKVGNYVTTYKDEQGITRLAKVLENYYVPSEAGHFVNTTLNELRKDFNNDSVIIKDMTDTVIKAIIRTINGWEENYSSREEAIQSHSLEELKADTKKRLEDYYSFSDYGKAIVKNLDGFFYLVSNTIYAVEGFKTVNNRDIINLSDKEVDTEFDENGEKINIIKEIEDDITTPEEDYDTESLKDEEEELVRERWQIKQDTESVFDRVSRRVRRKILLLESEEKNVLGRHKMYDFNETHNNLLDTLKYMTSEEDMISMLKYNIERFPVFKSILAMAEDDAQFSSELYKSYNLFGVEMLKVNSSYYSSSSYGKKYVNNLTYLSKRRVLTRSWVEDMKNAETHNYNFHIYSDAISLDSNNNKIINYQKVSANNLLLIQKINEVEERLNEAFKDARTVAEKQNVLSDLKFSFTDAYGNTYKDKNIFDYLMNELEIIYRAFSIDTPMKDLRRIYSPKFKHFISTNTTEITSNKSKDEIDEEIYRFGIVSSKVKITLSEVFFDIFSIAKSMTNNLDIEVNHHIKNHSEGFKKISTPQQFIDDASSIRNNYKDVANKIMSRIPTEGDANVTIDNKNRYSNRPDSYIGKVLKMFQRNNKDLMNEEELNSKFTNFLYETYAKYQGTISVLGSDTDSFENMLFYSPLLNSLKDKGSLDVRHLAYGNVASFIGKGWKDISPEEYLSLSMALFFDGYSPQVAGGSFGFYLTPIFADSPELGALKLRRFISRGVKSKAEDNVIGKDIQQFQYDIIENITQHVIAEINEYFLFKRRALNKNKKFTIKNADKNSPNDVAFAKFVFLNKKEYKDLIDSWEDILFPQNEENPVDEIFLSYGQDETINTIYHKLKDIVTIELDNKYNEFLESFKTKAVIQEKVKNKEVNKVVDGYKVPYTMQKQAGLDEVIADEKEVRRFEENLEVFFYNDYYAQVEMYTLFGINPRLYKDYIDINKRIKEIYASGSRLSTYAQRNFPYIVEERDGEVAVERIDFFDFDNEREIREEKKYRNVLLVKDFVSFSPIREKLLKKIEEQYGHNQEALIIQVQSLGLYNEVQEVDGKKRYFYRDKQNTLYEVEPMNLSDGQTILSMEESRRTQLYNGQEWTDAQEIAYQKYLIQVDINKRKGMTALEAHKDAHRHLTESFRPIKTFGFSDAGIETEDEYIGLFKGNTQIKHSEITLPVNDNTTQSDILSVITEVLNDINGELENEGIEKIDAISFDSTFKVGATEAIDINNLSPEEIKEKMINTAREGKLRKVPYNDFIVQQPTKEHFFDYKRQLIGSQLRRIMTADIPEDTTFNIKGRTLNKKEYIQVLNSLLNYQIQEDFNRISRTFKDNRKLAKRLRKAIVSNDAFSDSLLGFLELDSNGQFRIPLFDPQNSVQFSNVLTSIMRQEVNSMYIRGGKVINATSIGYNENLQLLTDEEGNPTYFEAIIPFPGSKEEYDRLKDIKGNIDMNKIDPDWLESVVYRIPTESDYSILPIKVKSFSPPSQSVSIILPVEALPITGMDLDFDSMYAFIFNYEILEIDGVFKLVKIDSGDAILDRVLETINSTEEKLSKKEREELEEETNNNIQGSSKIEGIDIKSSSDSELGRKLTNPSNNIGFNYKGRYYKNAEHAYQTWKSGSFDEISYNRGNKIAKNNPSKTDVINPKSRVDKSQSFSIMKDILTAKFIENPSLIEEVKDAGGEEFLSKSKHEVIGDNFWETKGGQGQNKFIEALTQAYKDAVGETESSIEVLEDDEIPLTEAEEIPDSRRMVEEILSDYSKQERDNLFIDLIIGKLVDPASIRKRLKIGNFKRLQKLTNIVYLLKEKGLSIDEINKLDKKGELQEIDFIKKDPLDFYTRSYVLSINNTASELIGIFAVASSFKNLATTVDDVYIMPHNDVKGGYVNDEQFMIDVMTNFLNLEDGLDVSEIINLSRIYTLDRNGKPTNNLSSEVISEQLTGAVDATKFPTHSIIGITPDNVNNFSGLLLSGVEMDKAVYANLKEGFTTGNYSDVKKSIPDNNRKNALNRKILLTLIKSLGIKAEELGMYNVSLNRLQKYRMDNIEISLKENNSNNATEAFNKAKKALNEKNEGLSKVLKEQILKDLKNYYDAKYALGENAMKLLFSKYKNIGNIAERNLRMPSVNLNTFIDSLDLANDLLFLTITEVGNTTSAMAINTRFDSKSSAPRRDLHQVANTIQKREDTLAGISTKLVPVFPDAYYDHFSSTMFNYSYKGLMDLLRRNMNTDNIYKVMNLSTILPAWSQSTVLNYSYTNYLLDNIKAGDIDTKSLKSILAIPNVFLYKAHNSEMSNNGFVQALAFTNGKLYLRSTGKVDKSAISNDLLNLYYNGTTRAETIALCAYEILVYGFSKDRGRFGGLIPAEIKNELFDLKPIERNPDLLNDYIKVEYLAYIYRGDLFYKVPETNIRTLEKFENKFAKRISENDVHLSVTVDSPEYEYQSLVYKVKDYVNNNLEVPEEDQQRLSELREILENNQIDYLKEDKKDDKTKEQKEKEFKTFLGETLTAYSTYLVNNDSGKFSEEELLENIRKLKDKIIEIYTYKKDNFGKRDGVVKVQVPGKVFLFVIEDLGEDNIEVRMFDELMAEQRIVPISSKQAILLNARKNALKAETYDQNVIDASLESINQMTSLFSSLNEARKDSRTTGEDFKVTENLADEDEEFTLSLGDDKFEELLHEGLNYNVPIEAFFMNNLFEKINSKEAIQEEVSRLDNFIRLASIQGAYKTGAYQGISLEKALELPIFEGMSKEEVEKIIERFNNLKC